MTLKITYTSTTKPLNEKNIKGFFVGWPNPPSESVFLKLLANSQYRILALDSENKLIGFITAISDGTLSAYIPFLEVLPEYQKQGIGKELVKQMMEKLKHLYMVDLSCDNDLTAFYKHLGMLKTNAMILRNYENQSGPN